MIYSRAIKRFIMTILIGSFICAMIILRVWLAKVGE